VKSGVNTGLVSFDHSFDQFVEYINIHEKVKEAGGGDVKRRVLGRGKL